MHCLPRNRRVRQHRLLSGKPKIVQFMFHVASHKWFDNFIILVRMTGGEARVYAAALCVVQADLTSIAFWRLDAWSFGS